MDLFVPELDQIISFKILKCPVCDDLFVRCSICTKVITKLGKHGCILHSLDAFLASKQTKPCEILINTSVGEFECGHLYRPA